MTTATIEPAPAGKYLVKAIDGPHAGRTVAICATLAEAHAFARIHKLSARESRPAFHTEGRGRA